MHGGYPGRQIRPGIPVTCGTLLTLFLDGFLAGVPPSSPPYSREYIQDKGVASPGPVTRSLLRRYCAVHAGYRIPDSMCRCATARVLPMLGLASPRTCVRSYATTLPYSALPTYLGTHPVPSRRVLRVLGLASPGTCVPSYAATYLPYPILPYPTLPRVHLLQSPTGTPGAGISIPGGRFGPPPTPLQEQ